ncbi:MAG: DMT family transporter [Sedimenticola sp.]|uniref:DMT family transporter n=1 Tax=Sedimenticola thiotaurini TaxID=1543721 RepID=A0A558D9U2_9GAMM|nr:DMT family transporter [Sedimenticola sp.]TVT57804.1 MAG: DMT family transporter [Sedimenticola thiotaurini]
MKTSNWKADSLLLITAIIWGLAFVAQRVGMDHMGPFQFNAARFTLGTLSLLPLLLIRRQKPQDWRPLILGSLVAGLLLFAGSSLQQIGLVNTTAGNAGFITGLYIVLVPIMALLWGHKTTGTTWLGALLALAGLFILSITDELTMASGDLLELGGAFFWAGHVLLIGWLSTRMDPLQLAFGQFFVCAIISALSALLWETLSTQAMLDAWIPISYAGLFSVGIAYTLQVVAQRKAPAAHAAIILSLEAVFAALGGWLLLDETLGPRGLIGCSMMLAGMLISQLPAFKFNQNKPAVI